MRAMQNKGSQEEGGSPAAQGWGIPSYTALATHRRIWHAAGEGHPALLPAVAGATAVKVDVEVPVFRAICPTALIL